jgi:HAE1 family hydrophobic/amphiphilic exporter-1
MAIDQGESSELWSPLAITMIGGIVSSTFLTLFVIPAIYLVFDDLKAFLKKLIPSNSIFRFSV